MSTTETEADPSTARSQQSAPQCRARTSLPTAPCTVVWSLGRPYVLEDTAGRPRWVGTDQRGRPLRLTCADLERRGWTARR